MSGQTTPRLAVVTGGTRGIGAAVAKRLVAQDYRVIALARSYPKVMTEGLGVMGLSVMVCDVSDPDDVERVFTAIAELGTIDVLINNAGISTSNSIGRTTVEEWNQNLAVNATGPFLCSQAVLPAMLKRSFGRIITVASTASLEGAPYIAAYAASKHAALGFMRVLAAEVTGTGVTANSVCPTFVRTEMTVASIANIANRSSCSLAEAEAKLATATPHGRILEIDEVASAIVDLVSSNDNGQEVLLDGGPT